MNSDDCRYEKALKHVGYELKRIKGYLSNQWLPEVIEMFDNEELLMIRYNINKLEYQIESLEHVVSGINKLIKIENKRK